MRVPGRRSGKVLAALPSQAGAAGHVHESVLQRRVEHCACAHGEADLNIDR